MVDAPGKQLIQVLEMTANAESVFWLDNEVEYKTGVCVGATIIMS